MAKFIEKKDIDEDENDDFVEEKEKNSISIVDSIKESYSEHKGLYIAALAVIILIIIMMIVNRTGGRSSSGGNVSLNPSKMTLSLNTSNDLTLKNINSSISDIKWQSADPTIAEVEGTGTSVKVKAISYGSTKIIVEYKKSGSAKSLECDVMVAEGDPNVQITNMDFQEGTLIISIGKSYQLTPRIVPSNGYVESMDFVSRDPLIATVDASTGRITGVSEGETTVNVTINDNFSASKRVIVVNEEIDSMITTVPDKIIFKENEVSVKEGESIDLDYTLSPSNANKNAISWLSSDTNIATVSNGKITGIKAGNATITAKVGKLTAEIKVKVTPDDVPVTSIVILNGTSISLNPGSTHTISYSVEPSTVINKAVTFSSSSQGVAVVDSNGIVTAISNGSCTITISSVSTPGVNSIVNISVTSSGGSTPSQPDSGSNTPTSKYGQITFKSDSTVITSYTSNINNVKFTQNDEKFSMSYSKSLDTGEKIKYCIYNYNTNTNCTPNKVYDLDNGERVSLSLKEYSGHPSGIVAAVYDKDGKMVDETKRMVYFYFNGTGVDNKDNNCDAGTYKTSSGMCLSCPGGYTSTKGSANKLDDCYRKVSAGMSLSSSGKEEECAIGYYSSERKVYYGQSSLCTKCPSGKTTSGTGSKYITSCKESVKVELDANGGTLNGGIHTIYVVKGEKLGKISDPTKTGEIFKGWYSNGGNSYDENSTITQDITLYARWQSNSGGTGPTNQTYTVTFHFNNPNKGVENVVVTAGTTLNDAYKKIKTPNYTSSSIGASVNGNLAGYYSAAKGGKRYDNNMIINENMNVYLHWNLIITFPQSVLKDGTKAGYCYPKSNNVTQSAIINVLSGFMGGTKAPTDYICNITYNRKTAVIDSDYSINYVCVMAYGEITPHCYNIALGLEK